MTSTMADLSDLCQNPTAPESMNDHEQNSTGIRTFTEALQVCNPNPVAHEPPNNLPLKAIGTLQEENLVLMRRVRELE